MDSPIRLLLVDDEARVRQGLRMCMAGEPDFEVVGEAEEGRGALDLVSELNPDVVVLDLRMRGMDGIEATRQLADIEAPRVVVLTLQDDAATRAEALASGAAAFVGKQEGIPRLFDAIRAVAGRQAAS